MQILRLQNPEEGNPGQTRGDEARVRRLQVLLLDLRQELQALHLPQGAHDVRPRGQAEEEARSQGQEEGHRAGSKTDCQE